MIKGFAHRFGLIRPAASDPLQAPPRRPAGMAWARPPPSPGQEDFPCAPRRGGGGSLSGAQRTRIQVGLAAALPLAAPGSSAASLVAGSPARGVGGCVPPLGCCATSHSSLAASVGFSFSHVNKPPGLNTFSRPERGLR